MRCYLLRKGHIAGVEILNRGLDEDLIEQGKAIFNGAPAGLFDGFEIWDLDRKVYIHSDEYVVGRPNGAGACSRP